MVLMICVTGYDFGSMRKAELLAEKGNLGIANDNSAMLKSSPRGRLIDMLLPIGALIVFAVLGLLYTGGYFGDDPQYHTLGAAFGNCSAATGLMYASFAALIVAFLLFVPRGLISYRGFMEGCVEGIKTMMPANIILVLAWTISGVCRDLLQTPQFVESVVTGGSMTAALLPAAVFVIAAFLSFSTGTAWGTFGILIPIVVPVAQALDPQLLVVSLSATLAGSVFGDHCSPISDTTILSSAGSGCNHVEHVSTQLGYSMLVAGCCIAGYLVAGFTHGNLPLSLGTSFVLLLGVVLGMHVRNQKREAAALRP